MKIFLEFCRRQFSVIAEIARAEGRASACVHNMENSTEEMTFSDSPILPSLSPSARWSGRLISKGEIRPLVNVHQWRHHQSTATDVALSLVHRRRSIMIFRKYFQLQYKQLKCRSSWLGMLSQCIVIADYLHTCTNSTRVCMYNIIYTCTWVLDPYI